jgi:hypothetical protein
LTTGSNLHGFDGQTTENVKAQLRRKKCDLVIIPGGMTGMLQPLDVIISWPFKAHIRRSYSEWAQKTHETTLMGCLKRATLMEMRCWILKAWRSVSQDMIAKSLKVTGVSDKMDWISCGIGPTKKAANRTQLIVN